MSPTEIERLFVEALPQAPLSRFEKWKANRIMNAPHRSRAKAAILDEFTAQLATSEVVAVTRGEDGTVSMAIDWADAIAEAIKIITSLRNLINMFRG